jgi:hypothetical protein
MSSTAASSTPANANPSAAAGSATKTDSSAAAGLGIVSLIFTIIFLFVWHLGAASLSYAKYGSVGWAILDFFFASFYYPFYAFFLNTPATPPSTMFGGRRKLKLW